MSRLAPLSSTATVVVVGLIMVGVFGQQYTGSVFVLALCYAIVTAGMAVQIGFSQQIVFSQCVFMGAGAYGVAMLNTHFAMPSLLATPIVMAGSGLAALALGSVVTRASGLALAVATLMLPLIAVGYVSSAGFLGGSVGAPLTGNLWPGSSTQSIAIGNGLITVALLAVAVFVASRILSSDIGLELYVLGVDEPTAAAMGVRTPRRRLELFVLGSVFAALGGAVYAGTQLFVPATLVSPTAELALLMMLFVGGRRSVLGAVAGAVAIQYLSGASNWVSVNILIVEGVLLTVVLLADPDGLAGLAASLTRRLPAPRLPAPRLPAPRLPARPGSVPITPMTPLASIAPLAPAAPLMPAPEPARWNIEPVMAGSNGTSSRLRRAPGGGCRESGAPGVRRHRQGIRRADRAGRGHADAATTGVVRAMRAERRRQIHAARHHRRQRAAQPRAGPARRRRRDPAAAAAALRPRGQPDLPGGAPDPRPHRAGQRGGRLPDLAPGRHRVPPVPQRARPGQAAGRTNPGPPRHDRAERPGHLVADAGEPADGRARPRPSRPPPGCRRTSPA